MNNNAFKENFDSYLIEMQEIAFQKLKAENEEYAGLRADIIDKSMEWGKVTKKLDPQDFQTYEEYSQCAMRTTCMEIDCLYLQGYKDCVKLLRTLEVI